MRVERKYLDLAMEVPRCYPEAPIKVIMGNCIGIQGAVYELLVKALQERVVQQGSVKFASMVSVVHLAY